jgi:hypothetical protein
MRERFQTSLMGPRNLQKDWILRPGMGYMPVIPALRNWRQEDHKFETSLGYIVRPCLKKKKKKSTKTGPSSLGQESQVSKIC